MLDWDHFKAVNDTHGHLVGDEVLRRLGGLLSKRLRASDVISRLGGEQFGVLVPNTSVQQAAAILDVLRDRFAREIFQGDGRDFRVTFSCGVASSAEHDDENDLHRAADQGLYQAKGSGRNCVIVSR